ncbi:transposase, partial [Macrococcus capreoli]
ANKHRFRKVVVKKSVAHYKDELDKEINEVRKSEGKKEFTPTHKTEEKEKKESLTDPDAGYYVKGEREKQFAYSLHACVDKNGFFVDHHVTPGNIHDSTQLAPMISRMKDKGIKPKTLAVDAGYKTPFNAYFLFKESITP